MEVLLPALIILLISNICLGKDIDLISRTKFLKNGDTIISKGGTFVMGFFNPTNSLNHYIGIWYKQDPAKTVVWVANRDAPLANTTSAVLKITLGGQLSLVGDKGQPVWSANTSTSSVQNPVAELLDSGNLVVRDADDENPENFVWQSFDHPTDHLLPGMKFGWNLQTGHEVFLTAWKGENDPASGQYTQHLDVTGYPQLILKNGTTEIFSTGPWNGLRFSVSTVEQNINNIGPQVVVINKKEVYFWYNPSNDFGLFRFVVTSNGFIKAWVWEDEMNQWVSYRRQPADICATYGLCGGNCVCNIQQFHGCVCLDKFLPNNNATVTGTLSRGCRRRKPLNCHNNGSSSDGFLKYSNIKLPDTRHSWYNESMSLQECEQVCLRNCSCMAYSTLNISNGGRGCLIWYGDLVDMRPVQNGQDMFIRLAASEIPGLKAEPHHSTSFRRKIKILALCLSLLVVIVLAGVYLFLYFCKRKRKEQKLEQELELPIYDQSTISRATNNFSEINKLGQGGFGAVYKGALDGGEEIAVKRLSKNSKQGLEEFKNEVICIAKLQHRNLVKLLGCCISEEEKMLIYEYMPNKSLDFFIFDQTKKRLLDWPKRFNIINGVARGLLYLHQDSRLRIIHRDIKVSNVLLDIDLNPKISDFGLARSIVGNAVGDNTKRVAGTHGYMSPEYAGHGIFSVKSDVFSFGISVLEIVSGRRNNKFINEDQYMTLPEHAWRLYREGKPIALVDKDIAGPYDVVQVLRSIHIALLCVQQSPDDRPDMSSVVQMLVNDFALPQAKEPGFFFGKEYPPKRHAKSSLNEVTITTMSPR
ncbi:PREDICTED: G-type lectin S-receptor-like serine/threonine-protein kinase At4g27290 [Ipomoea nil]|uniref:G-type lectin S-receptor-like serine/threonine-protein kinase At4g27290 n=1 Tax=Ipomoea nil TaxID=35883 RepID=UPI000900AEF9|nr:PREDICTED: G-type lectin S-receptor-like serine/threonine-protein kinase At4g27290 [Ipomoea nil]